MKIKTLGAIIGLCLFLIGSGLLLKSIDLVSYALPLLFVGVGLILGSTLIDINEMELAK